MRLLKTKGNGNLFPKVVNDFFDTDFFARPNLFDVENAFTRWGGVMTPSVNIVEKNKEFEIELAAPGLEKKDFKVEIENGVLSVSCEKKQEEKEENENYRRREFSFQSFNRAFELPENSLPEKIDAHYEHGILKLTLPKREETGVKSKREIKID
jgi:HSP20 family protein